MFRKNTMVLIDAMFNENVGGDIRGGKKARSKMIFSNLTKVRTLNKTVGITCLQHYSF